MFLVNAWPASWMGLLSVVIGIIALLIATHVVGDNQPIWGLTTTAMGLLLIFAGPVGIGFMHHHERVVLQARERTAISSKMGVQKIVSLQDDGKDFPFSSMRDVFVLTAKGKTDLFYYSPTTGNVVSGNRVRK